MKEVFPSVMEKPWAGRPGLSLILATSGSESSETPLAGSIALRGEQRPSCPGELAALCLSPLLQDGSDCCCSLGGGDGIGTNA